MAVPTFSGVLVSWFEPRNYGFIHPDHPIPNCDMELFCHVSDMPNLQPLPQKFACRI